MALSQTTVIGPVYLPNCEKPEEAKIVFELTSWDREDGEATFVTGPYVGDLDEQGNFSVDLFTTTEGENGAIYRASAIYKTLSGEHVREYFGYFTLIGPGPVHFSSLDITNEYTAHTFDALTEIADHVHELRLSRGSQYAEDAQAYYNNAVLAAEVSGVTHFFDTKAQADAALVATTIANDDVIIVFNDESKDDFRTFYKVESNALVFKTYANHFAQSPFFQDWDSAIAAIDLDVLKADVDRVFPVGSYIQIGSTTVVVEEFENILYPRGSYLKPYLNEVHISNFGDLSEDVLDAAANTTILQKGVNYCALTSSTLFIPKGVWPHNGMYFYKDTNNPQFPDDPYVQSTVFMKGSMSPSRRDTRINEDYEYGTVLEYVGGGATGYYGAKLFDETGYAIYSSSGLRISNMCLAGTSTGYLVQIDGLTDSHWADQVTVLQRGSGNGVLQKNGWFTSANRLQIDHEVTQADNTANPYYQTGRGLWVWNEERAGGNLKFNQCDATGWNENMVIGQPDYTQTTSILNDVTFSSSSVHLGNYGVVIGRGARFVLWDGHVEAHENTGTWVHANAGLVRLSGYYFNPDATTADVRFGSTESGAQSWFSGGTFEATIMEANVVGVLIDSVGGTRGLEIRGAVNPGSTSSIGVKGPSGKYAGSGEGIMLNQFDVSSMTIPYEDIPSETIILSQYGVQLPPLTRRRTKVDTDIISVASTDGIQYISPNNTDFVKPQYLYQTTGSGTVALHLIQPTQVEDQDDFVIVNVAASLQDIKLRAATGSVDLCTLAPGEAARVMTSNGFWIAFKATAVA